MVSKKTSIAAAAAGDSGAAEAPLLPEQYAGAGAPAAGASVLGAVFNVSTSVVGAGIMSIPAAMRVLGVAPTVALVVGVALLANAAVDFMLRYTRGPSSYAALMGDAFGRAGATLLNVFVAFNAIGTLTVYLIIIGEVISGTTSGGKAHDGVLMEWFGQHWWTGREAVLVAAAVLLLPLVLRKRVGTFTEVHIGRVHPTGGGVHAHQSGYRDVRPLQRHSEDAADAPGLLAPLLAVRALHRRPHNRRRIHLPLQRAPDPSGAEQDVGHEGGRAHLARHLHRHLRGGGVLRLPPLRRRHHGRRARQLRPQLRRRGPAGAQRRGAPQLRAAPRARLPAAPLLAPRQRRRAPVPGEAVAGHGYAPVRGAHGRAHGGALRARHRHPQHLDALRVLRVNLRRLHLVDLPRRHRSQGCSWDSKEEGQGIGGDDDHSGRDHEQHRHRFQRHELHQRQGGRGPCRSYVARGILVCCPTASRFKRLLPL